MLRGGRDGDGAVYIILLYLMSDNQRTTLRAQRCRAAACDGLACGSFS